MAHFLGKPVPEHAATPRKPRAKKPASSPKWGALLVLPVIACGALLASQEAAITPGVSERSTGAALTRALNPTSTPSSRNLAAATPASQPDTCKNTSVSITSASVQVTGTGSKQPPLTVAYSATVPAPGIGGILQRPAIQGKLYYARISLTGELSEWSNRAVTFSPPQGDVLSGTITLKATDTIGGKPLSELGEFRFALLVHAQGEANTVNRCANTTYATGLAVNTGGGTTTNGTGGTGGEGTDPGDTSPEYNADAICSAQKVRDVFLDGNNSLKEIFPIVPNGVRGMFDDKEGVAGQPQKFIAGKYMKEDGKTAVESEAEIICSPTYWGREVAYLFVFKGLALLNWFAQALAILITLYAGLLYMTGFYNEGNVKTAKSMLIGAYVGLAIVLLAKVLVYGAITVAVTNDPYQAACAAPPIPGLETTGNGESAPCATQGSN